MKTLYRRHQYWSAEGIKWTNWYKVTFRPKRLERYEQSTGRIKLLCEYKEVEESKK